MTARSVLPVIPLYVAEIAVVPGLLAVARPWDPLALLMVAYFPIEDAQVTEVVRSRVLPSS